MAETTGNTSLFPVFILSILSLVLIPWSIYKCCCADTTEAAKLWESADKKKGFLKKIRSLFTVENVILVLLWLLMAFLVLHIQQTQKDMSPFDPFEILGVTPASTPAEIKKAYRRLSLIYHPDKNPDPEAHKYFAEYVTKAHQALTDPIAKENYEKHGHPDGPQAMDFGIALPEWLFTKDPRVLLVLVVVFVLLPLSTMAWYLFRSDEYGGSNNILRETLANYAYSRNCIKESQSIVRIPETLVVAKEFIMMYTPDDHQIALDDLRRVILGFHPELKERPQFWKRRASVVKAHLLFFAHLQRVHEEVPVTLKANLNFVLEKSIPLLQEMFKIACIPRRPFGYGWLAPATACIQCMQCVTQAVPLTSRRSLQTAKKDSNEGYAALLQLPGIDEEAARILGKKRIRNINNLIDLAEGDRTKLFRDLGFDDSQLQDLDTALQSLPTIEMTADLFVEGEEEIGEGDVVTCRVRLILTRRSHSTGDVSDADFRGNGVQCFSPHYPFPRDEKWYVMLTWMKHNSVITWKHVILKDAEVESLRRKANDDKEIGQVVELQFQALFEGNFEFQVACFSDCWIGCDTIIPVKFKVKKAKKIRVATKPTSTISDGEDDAEVSTAAESDQAEDSGDGRESEKNEDKEEEGTEDEYAYDSEESGELETGSDEEAVAEIDPCEQ